jgi:hypothetical protein
MHSIACRGIPITMGKGRSDTYTGTVIGTSLGTGMLYIRQFRYCHEHCTVTFRVLGVDQSSASAPSPNILLFSRLVHSPISEGRLGCMVLPQNPWVLVATLPCFWNVVQM